jgi:taurine dioxygenase
MSKLDGAKTESLSGSLGTLVSGLDLRDAQGPEDVAALRQLLLDRLVLIFPDQHLSPDEQRKLMACFGEVEKHPERPRVLEDSDEEVVVITPSAGVSAVWHCDYEPDFLPCGICSLNMVENAADGGGDTIFVNAYRIYESFSIRMQSLLDGLTAVHRNTGNSGRQRDEAWFPLVGTHPETGRKGLFYSAHHVQDFVELVPEESALLLSRLQQLTQKPNFALRYHWGAGALALWDNRAVQHYVVPDFEGSRLLYQVTVKGAMLEPLPGYRAPDAADFVSGVSEIAAR